MNRRSPHHSHAPHPRSVLGRVWLRFGLLGFGLLMPCLIGVPLTGIVGLALGIGHRPLSLWSGLGVVLTNAVVYAVVT